MLSPVKITVREHVVLPLEPEAAYDFFITPEAYRLFTGWGPIPGIREVVWESGEAASLGAYGRVHNSDGSTHREHVVRADRGEVYVLKIDQISSAFRHLVRGIEEEARFTAVGSATKLTRTFVFDGRSPIYWPVLRATSQMFRAAVRKNHAAFLTRLAE